MNACVSQMTINFIQDLEEPLFVSLIIFVVISNSPLYASAFLVSSVDLLVITFIIIII
jgi:hypothetical protein